LQTKFFGAFLVLMYIHHLEMLAAEYPARLREPLGATAPPKLTALGNRALLTIPKTALFCSSRCPGRVILTTYDQAAKWRDGGRCVISGFHSPVEKECLQILLRGSQPIIICPARSLPQRVPPEWKIPLTAGRLLILSAFAATENRVTAELASRRNEFVAALADEVWFAHITPGGEMERLSRRVAGWAVPQQVVDISKKDQVRDHF
jgi:predicted Rossmann fold nucleotide-binding protein DprA/Smf involved in DNA uptake